MKTSEINQLGKELELFTSIDYIGKGFPIMLPRGARLIKNLRNYIEYLEERNGYKIVRTPSISNSKLYQIQDRYGDEDRDQMFIIDNGDDNYDDENALVLRPYAEPFHCAIYATKQHSYRELPIKLCETSTVYRNESDLRGINVVRQFTMSDASKFCEPQKAEAELYESLKFQQVLLNKMQLEEISYELCTWDDSRKEEYIGTIAEWNDMTNAMQRAMERLGIEYTVDKNAKLYGPFIRIKQNNNNFSKLQVDFEITHRFDLKYTNQDNEEQTPIYIHNTLIGSYENLIGILLEQFQGNIPLWLEPHQVVIIPDGENVREFAEQIRKELLAHSIRVEMDDTNISKTKRIERNLQIKVPYVILIDKDHLNRNQLRLCTKNEEQNIDFEDLINLINERLAKEGFVRDT